MAGQYISTYARMQAKGVRQLVASAVPGSEAWAQAQQQAAALAAAQAEQQGLEMMQAQGEADAWLPAQPMTEAQGRLRAQQQVAALGQWPQRWRLCVSDLSEAHPHSAAKNCSTGRMPNHPCSLSCA